MFAKAVCHWLFGLMMLGIAGCEDWQDFLDCLCDSQSAETGYSAPFFKKFQFESVTGADFYEIELDYLDDGLPPIRMPYQAPHTNGTSETVITYDGRSYRIRVRAVNENGSGEWSDWSQDQSGVFK